MSSTIAGGDRWRSNPFDRGSPLPSPNPNMSQDRPRSAVLTSPPSASNPGHSRGHSFSPMSGSRIVPLQPTRPRSNSSKASQQSSNTFAPQFIKSEELQRSSDGVGGIEGENDFSGKRYVWLRDQQLAFVRGWVVEELDDSRLLVQCDNGTVRGNDSDQAVASADSCIATRG